MKDSNTFSGFEAYFKAAAGGDSEAFWRLIQDSEYNRIVGSCLNNFGLNPIDAEEIKSKFMMHLRNQWPATKPIPNPQGYLRSAIRNFFISEKRMSLKSPDDFGQRRKKDWHKPDAKSLVNEKSNTLYAKLPEKVRAGVDNAALFVQRLDEVGRRCLADRNTEKYVKTYDHLVRLEKDLVKIWGSKYIKTLSEFRLIKNKSEEARSRDERQQYGRICKEYPAIHLIDAINSDKERASKAADSFFWEFDFSFLLIFDNLSEIGSFFKLRMSPDRILFDVLAKLPTMSKGEYRDLNKIRLIMTATGNGGRIDIKNLRQYSYRQTSKPRLYRQAINRIYKRSFIDQINIKRPFDIHYQLAKEGRIGGLSEDDLKRNKEIRDQQRKLLKSSRPNLVQKN